MTKLSGFNESIVREMITLAALLVIWAMPMIQQMVCFEKNCGVVFIIRLKTPLCQCIAQILK